MSTFIMRETIYREYKIEAEDAEGALLQWEDMDEDELDQAYLGEYISSEAPRLQEV